MANNYYKQTTKKDVRGRTVNVLETLRDVSSKTSKSLASASVSGVKTLTHELVNDAPRDFMDQLFGPEPTKTSADIVAGESLEIKDPNQEASEKIKRLQLHLQYERRLRQEDSIFVREKQNELRLELQAITQQVVDLTDQTQGFAQEVRLAAMQTPVEVGVYDIIFFTNLLKFLEKFRKKLQNVTSLLSNRKEGKGWLANYKKYGAKYLLSGEHYATRSAG